MGLAMGFKQWCDKCLDYKGYHSHYEAPIAVLNETQMKMGGLKRGFESGGIKVVESKSGGIPAKKKNGTLDLRYKKNIETLEKQKVI